MTEDVDVDVGADVRPRSTNPRPSRKRKGLRAYAGLGRAPYVLIAVSSFALLLALWSAASALEVVSDLFLPSPLQVWSAGVEMAMNGTLWNDLQASFWRITIGFLASSIIAIPLGVAVGVYRPVQAAAQPTLDFVRYMPAVAFVPLTIIWVGVGEPQKWLVIFIGTFFFQTLMFTDNVKRVPRDLVNVGLTLGLGQLALLYRIIVPAAAPAMWDTLRTTLGWAWTWLIVAELVAASEGLGYRIVLAQRFFRTDTIFISILIIGLLGLIMDQLMRGLGSRLFRWSEGP